MRVHLTISEHKSQREYIEDYYNEESGIFSDF
jgi:hypothetical protein